MQQYPVFGQEQIYSYPPQQNQINEQVQHQSEYVSQESCQSNQSSQYFKIKIKSNSSTSYELNGSLRFCKMFILIFIGIGILYGVNIAIDNECLQKFIQNSCSFDQNNNYQCNDLAKCIQYHQHYYFSHEENFIISIAYVLSIFTISVWKKQLPRIKYKKSQLFDCKKKY